ncbi:MAG: immunoglobulin domain-containing protein, partial [Candidatus Kapaibacterium sp.]
FTIASASSADVGIYDCMVNSRCYASPLLSSSFTILVDVPIGILAQPESLVSCTGQEAQFVVSVYGSEPTYQWMKDGEPIDGNVTAQTNHLVLTGLDADDAGTYAVRVGSRCSDISILSQEAMLTVLPMPAFIEFPAGARVCERGSVALQARASGVDVRYQWIHDGQEVEGATDSVLYLYDVTPAAGGT